MDADIADSRDFRYSVSARRRLLAMILILVLGIGASMYGLTQSDPKTIKFLVNIVALLGLMLLLTLWGANTVFAIYRLRDNCLEVRSFTGQKKLELGHAHIRVISRKNGLTSNYLVAPGGTFFLAHDPGLADLVAYLEQTLPYESQSAIPNETPDTYRPPKWTRIGYWVSIIFWGLWLLLVTFLTFAPHFFDGDPLPVTASILFFAFFGTATLASIYATWSTAYTVSLGSNYVTKKQVWRKPVTVHLSSPDQVSWHRTTLILSDSNKRLKFTSSQLAEFDAFVSRIELMADYPEPNPPPTPYLIALSARAQSLGALAALIVPFAAFAVWTWTLDDANLSLQIVISVSVIVIAYSAYNERKKQLKHVIADSGRITFEYFGHTDVRNVTDLEHIAFLPSQSGISCVFRDTTIPIPAFRCTKPPYEVARKLRAIYNL